MGCRRPAARILGSVPDGLPAWRTRPRASAFALDRARCLALHRARTDPRHRPLLRPRRPPLPQSWMRALHGLMRVRRPVRARHRRRAADHEDRRTVGPCAGSRARPRDGKAASERIHVMPRLAFVVVGHVDHGKSTLVGRLLADTGALEPDRVDKVRRICQEQRKRFEYAFLLDALEEEQLQGVTIDITEARFRCGDRDYLVIDAPGHQEFLKNMISGAAHADAALLLVDAKEGVQEQSRRHAYLLSFLGIRQIAVVVSKMDLVDFSQTIFDRIVDDYSPVLGDLGLQPVAFVPVSATDGDNVTVHSERLPWYRGPSVLEVLRRFPVAPQGL